MPKIKAIEFRLFSPQQIKKLGVVEITRPELYDADGYPVEKGLMDPRLGVIDPGSRCRICGGNIDTCMGHFGYIQLVKPCIHPALAPYIYLLLKATCKKCGRILADEKIKGLSECAKNAKSVCPFCKTKQGKIKFDKPYAFYEDNKELSNEEIRERLERIPDEDLERMHFKGFRPEWAVLTVLPIPPLCVRPSIILETGERSEDDLTHKLVDIVRINERLKRILEIGAPDFVVKDVTELLQYHVATYLINELPNIPPARHRSGRPLKTLAQRLIGKEGRLRYNLTGKRVNFCARSVISPDNFLEINEVGVPYEVAMTLTVPEPVLENNIEELRKLILNGPNKYPGANYVIRPDGMRKRITEENKELIANEIVPGYIVERHLRDGDWAIFNRQPSLHRMSMLGHRVRVLPGKTLRLHLAVTTPYNADFDGDEMNLHIPQTPEAIAEVKHLMDVNKHIRSPRYGLPIIGAKQDIIMGCYLLTRKEVVLSKTEVANLLYWAGIKDIELTKEKYTGKEVFSFLLPKGLNIEFKSSSCRKCYKCRKENCVHDAYVVVKDGKLIKGVIDKAAIGAEKGKLLNKIDLLYGSDFAAEFLDKITRISILILLRLNYTLSISDFDLPGKEKLKQEIENAIKEYIRKRKRGVSDDIALPELEAVLNKAEQFVREHIPIEKDSIKIAESGARGSIINITQICGLVGQEKSKGKKITRGYYNRTLPHFKKFELHPKAYGFVAGNYREGLDPIEFFFDALNSREGLSDTALKTRHSGYLERRIMHCLHDIKVTYDGLVRDEAGRVIQFEPLGDNVYPYNSDEGKIDLESIL